MFVNAILLAGMLVLPLGLLVGACWIFRGRGLDAHYEQPTTIDYDKW